MEKSNKFLQQLDELIKLFEELQKRATNEGIIIKDDPMYKNFELLAGNYRMIKGTIPPELIEEIGEPIKEMIMQMVEQLKKELGIEAETIVKPDFPVDNTDNSILSELDNIDKMLKEGNLTEEDMNNLLDKRSNLNMDL